jgi:hypothetical protein
MGQMNYISSVPLDFPAGLQVYKYGAWNDSLNGSVSSWEER